MDRVSDTNLPHICLYGPIGAPFSNAVRTICLRCGADVAGRNVLIMDGLEGLGIGEVRDQIRRFAQCNIVGAERWKIVVLYNADLISPAGQAALRRIMEIYAKDTRFIFSTCARDDVIAPLRSRTLAIFVPLSPLNSSPLRRLRDQIVASRQEAARIAVSRLRPEEKTVKELLVAADRFASHGWETRGMAGDLAFDWLAELVGDGEK